LYYNLSNYYIPILRLVMPSLNPVTIRPESLDDGNSYACAGGVVTSFSAGIDSFCTIHDHLIADVPPHFRLTHLVFSNVGSKGQRQVRDTKFADDCSQPDTS
jgi:hypothetical protein